MLRFVVRRLAGMVGVLFAISVLVFLIFNVIPNSDPAARIAGKNADPELIARVSADLGLDQPLAVPDDDEADLHRSADLLCQLAERRRTDLEGPAGKFTDRAQAFGGRGLAADGN